MDAFTLSVDNTSGIEQATVFLNGYRIGDVEGGAKRDFRVLEHNLIHGRCATVAVRFHPSLRLLRSVDTNANEECLERGGSQYTLAITNSQKALWLTPWARR